MTTATTLVVDLKAKPESADAVYEATRSVIPEVMKEPHFGEINLYRDPEDPTHIAVIERWGSREYLQSDAHQQSPHLSSYFETITPLLAEPARWALFNHEGRFAND